MPENISSQFNRVYGFPIETHRSVSTILERDNIPGGVRWEGMLVYVSQAGEKRTYELRGGLTNEFWIEIGTTGGQVIDQWLIVDTVDDLQVTDRQNREASYVIDTVRGGTFTYAHSSSGLTANNGTIFNASDGGFWVRQYEGHLLVRWFGGGNGDPIEDTQVLQSVFSLEGSHNVLGEREVTYFINDTVIIAANRFGVDFNSSVIDCSNLTGSIALLVASDEDIPASERGILNTNPIGGFHLIDQPTNGNTAIQLGNGTFRSNLIALENYGVHGFNVGLTFVSHTWNVSSTHFTINGCNTGLLVPTGLTNAGERITFINGGISGSGIAVSNNRGPCTVHFVTCSLDNNEGVVYQSGGKVLFDSCFIEQGTGETEGTDVTYWFHQDNTNPASRSHMSFCNTHINWQPDVDEKTQFEMFYSNNANVIAFYFYGTQLSIPASNVYTLPSIFGGVGEAETQGLIKQGTSVPDFPGMGGLETVSFKQTLFDAPAFKVARVLQTGTIGNNQWPLRIIGNGTGVSNQVEIGFYEEDTVTRTGRIGFNTNTGSGFVIINELIGNAIWLTQSPNVTNGLRYFDGTNAYRVLHGGNFSEIITPNQQITVDVPASSAKERVVADVTVPGALVSDAVILVSTIAGHPLDLVYENVTVTAPDTIRFYFLNYAGATTGAFQIQPIIKLIKNEAQI